MRKLRVYIDTSVFGGIADEEFAAPSQRFFARVMRGEFTVLLSTEVLQELGDAPNTVKQVFEGIPEDLVENIDVDVVVESLAEAYLAAGVLGPASRRDAIHVAAATIADADLIVSWNFKHIVNYSRIRKFNAVNVLEGYMAIEIRSPAEVGYVE